MEKNGSKSGSRSFFSERFESRISTVISWMEGSRGDTIRFDGVAHIEISLVALFESENDRIRDEETRDRSTSDSFTVLI